MKYQSRPKHRYTKVQMYRIGGSVSASKKLTSPNKIACTLRNSAKVQMYVYRPELLPSRRRVSEDNPTASHSQYAPFSRCADIEDSGGARIKVRRCVKRVVAIVVSEPAASGRP